jgi:uncharacterized protein
MIEQSAILKSLYRYPVKGLSPQALQRIVLSAGETVPGDRRYAIENGPSGFDPAAPAYYPKQRFLMLMRNERLAALHVEYDETGHAITIKADRQTLRGDLRTLEGRAAVENFFARYCKDELRGPPKMLFGDGHSFSDVAKKVVSIINLASVADIESAAGHPAHPLRFRGNFYVTGWPAWHEFDLLDREIIVGKARLKVVKRIKRCAAVDVDPDTGIRDLTIPRTLIQSFGHADCGVYAEVLEGGMVTRGDSVAVKS